MKRSPRLMAFVIAALLLSACGSRATSTTGASGTGGTARRGLTITPGIKLALGTIKLEGTQQAVDPAMAAKLLPLWQLLLQLDSSTSAAPQEVTAVLDQINATMTPAQVSAIGSMQITQADFASLFQGQGASGTAGAAGAAGANPGAGGGFGGGGFAGGGFPGGGFPGGGFGGGGTRPAGTTTSGTTGSTTTARSQTTAAVPGFLVNQVISLLQSKITS